MKNSIESNWRPVLDEYHSSLKDAAGILAAFVSDITATASEYAGSGKVFPPLARWVTLSGIAGCGKTMLAEQAFKEAMKFNPADAVGAWITGTGTYSERMRRPCSFWMTATEFADRMRRDFDYAEYLGRDFLVAIDDVGAARDNSAFVAEALYRLCNARLGKWTIFTTNFSLAEIAKNVDERVASRMIRDGNVFHRIAAGDYAMRPKGAR